jgi:UDPglucose--hexose-1-phosphate uridylyltransferase
LTVRITTAQLSDGRTIRYYDEGNGRRGRDLIDPRPLPPPEGASEIRHDPLLDVPVIIAARRQARSYHPAADDCPLCPSRPGHPTEIPASDYDVVVIENRFPALAAAEAHADDRQSGDGRHDGLLRHRRGVGRCEVVCFTSDHGASFVDLDASRVGTVLAAWTDRSVGLIALPEVTEVFCFENRGREIGVTLEHPHGQIYAYPFVTPRTARTLGALAAHRAVTGRNLFDDVVAAELAAEERVVAANDHWLAFVPHAARWPYEVHLYPRRRVPDLHSVGDDARRAFASIYLDLLRRFDGLFDGRTPYIAGWHQAPDVPGGTEIALHLELFTVRRAPGRLKYLAGSESGMDVFTNDVVPEAAAARLRQLAPPPSG